MKFGKTQITLVLEGFRINQAHHSNRLGETVKFINSSNHTIHFFINSSTFFINLNHTPSLVHQFINFFHQFINSSNHTISLFHQFINFSKLHQFIKPHTFTFSSIHQFINPLKSAYLEPRVHLPKKQNNIRRNPYKIFSFL